MKHVQNAWRIMLPNREEFAQNVQQIMKLWINDALLYVEMDLMILQNNAMMETQTREMDAPIHAKLNLVGLVTICILQHAVLIKLVETG